MSDEMGTQQGVTPNLPPAGPVGTEPTPAPAPAPPMTPPAVPVVSAKPKIDALFFIIGFVIAMLALPLGSGAIGAALSAVPINGVVGTAILLGLVIVVIAVFVSLMVAGRRRGNDRLRSFGLGGLWASVAIPLVLLLTIGSCLVLTGQTSA